MKIQAIVNSDFFIMLLLFLSFTTIIPVHAATDNVQPSPNFKFSHLSLEDGLSNTNIMAVWQDYQGFMWFGTQKGGLNRYDGYEFKVYKNEADDDTSLSNNFIWSMVEDSLNNLWIGTNGGSLNRYDRERDRFIRYASESGVPHTNIKSIFEDSEGTLWVGGSSANGFSKLNRETGKFFTYHTEHDDGIRAIHQDRETGLLWLGTYDYGVLLFDAKTEKFVQKFPFDSNAPNSISSNTVQDITQTKNGEIWIATTNGLNRFNRETETFTRYYHNPDDPNSLSDNRVERVLEDSQGRLWISSSNGINIYHPQTDDFITLYHDSDNRFSLSDSFTRSLFEDSSGAVWVGTDNDGLSRLASEPEKFALYLSSPSDDSLSNNSVNIFNVDSQNRVWVGTSQGLNLFNGKTFTRYLHDPADSTSLSSNEITAIVEDPDGSYWIGTDIGLNHFDGHHFTRYLHNSQNSETIAGNHIRGIYPDRDGGLWLSVYNVGMDYFDGKTFRHFKPGQDNNGGIMSRWPSEIVKDRYGNRVWICTFGDIMELDLKSKTFTHIFPTAELKGKIPPNQYITIFQDKNGLLWIGGAESGLMLFNPDSREVLEHYRKKHGLADNNISHIIADKQGVLWISTQNGLSRFDPGSKTFHNYYAEHGLQSNQMTRSAITSDGQIFVGGPKGMNAFYPEQIKNNPTVPPVVLTGFELFNEPVVIGEKGSPLTSAINVISELVLSYAQSVFSFEFAALNYSVSEMNQYAYKLEGFDEDWRYTGSSRRFATYTNLDPGEYTFRVKASNNDGIWNEAGLSLPVVITPPWWQTVWFRILAALLIIGTIVGVFFMQRQNAKRREHILKTLVAERTYDLQTAKDRADAANQAKSTFLSNMSHELRTPLNAILGFSEMMSHDRESSSQQKEKVSIINRSGKHLLSMINDVLDLSKIEAGRIELEPEAFDLPHMLADIVNMFKMRCETTGLRFEAEIAPQLITYIKADSGKVRQILINLLGNSVKFTEEGGVALRVRHIQIKDDPDMVTLILEIEDSGSGMSAEQTKKIFEPFVQAGDSSSKSKGTGLGLAITKSFVDLMGGKISIESELGKGALFRIELPAALADGVDIESNNSKQKTVVGLMAGQPLWRVLIVEDMPDNRLMLTSLLREVGYQTKAVENGEEAVKLFKQWQPHFIWMDMRMPVMDGYEATTKIRELPDGDAVKIVAVTASVFKEQRPKIMQAGCDALVHKPFRSHEIFDCMADLLGAKYLYEEQDEETIKAPLEKLTREQLSDLPPSIMQELYVAAQQLDQARVQEIAQQIAEIDPGIARAIISLADSFEWEQLLALLNIDEK